MPGNIPKLVIPTGYEPQQEAIARRQKLADLMLEKGLSSQGNMTSWSQPLAEMAQIFAGKRMQKKADVAESALDDKIKGDYTSQLGGFFGDVNKGMSDKDLVEKYASSPLLADALKVHSDAYGKSLEQAGELTTFNGQNRTKGSIPIGAVDYTQKLTPGSDGQMHVNPLVASANLESQYPPDHTLPGTLTNAMPVPGLLPVPGASPAPGGGPTPTQPVTGGNSVDISLLNPQEKQILTTELQRRAGNVGPTGGSGYALQNDMHTPFGNPLDAQKPPSGVVNGKPYWIVNGVPFDNPEGK